MKYFNVKSILSLLLVFFIFLLMLMLMLILLFCLCFVFVSISCFVALHLFINCIFGLLFTGISITKIAHNIVLLVYMFSISCVYSLYFVFQTMLFFEKFVNYLEKKKCLQRKYVNYMCCETLIDNFIQPRRKLFISYSNRKLYNYLISQYLLYLHSTFDT